MSDPTTFEKLRPCGRLETFSTARHHLNFYTNVGTSATYSHPSSSVPLKLLVFSALRKVIAQHSILSAIPLNEDQSYPGPYFARVPSIDLQTCISFVERKSRSVEDGVRDEELDHVLEEQHNLNFKDGLGSRPFWRLVILSTPGAVTTFTAVLIVHHALADGTSGLVFHRSFLAALRTIISIDGGNVDPIVVSPTEPLLPPLEELHPLPISWLFLVQQQWNEWFPSPVAKLWTGSPVTAPNPTQRTHVKSLILSRDQTTTLVALCRANKTTVTAALQTLVGSALLANLNSEDFEVVNSNGVISLRPNLKLEGKNINEQIGVWVSAYSHSFTRSPSENPSDPLSSFSWASARAVKATITQTVASNGSNAVVGLLRWVSDLQAFFTKRVGLPRSDSFEVSNVGVFKMVEEEQGWNIGRTVFSQCGNVAGPAFHVSAATGGDGCLSLAFSWLEGVVERELLKRVMGDVSKGVDGILAMEG